MRMKRTIIMFMGVVGVNHSNPVLWNNEWTSAGGNRSRIIRWKQQPPITMDSLSKSTDERKLLQGEHL